MSTIWQTLVEFRLTREDFTGVTFNGLHQSPIQNPDFKVIGVFRRQ